MALIVSESSQGGDIVSKVDYGDLTVGNSGQKAFYLRNTYNNYISDVTLYYNETQSGYDGNASASTDFAEMKEWGDNDATHTTDGVFLSQDGAASWTQLQTNQLDSQSNGVLISTTSGVSTNEQIQGGGTDEGVVYTKISVPSGEADGGIRNFDLNIYYKYTS